MNPSLNPGEVEALLKAVESGAISPGSDTITTIAYDFKRPERVSKEQIRALANLHEVFARSFGASLSGMLRTVTEARLEAMAQMTYQEFVAGLPNPTCFTLFSCQPLAGSMMVEFGPDMMFPVMDRLLGGGHGAPPVMARPLTAIEWTLAGTITRRALEDLTAMWAIVRKLTLAPVSSESNPLLIQAMPPNELVVVASFSVRVGEAAGRMNLCLPYVTIEPLVADVEAHSWYPAATSATAAPPAVRGPLSQASIRISSVLAETTMTLRELLNLEKGDLIETGRPGAGTVTLLIEGKPKFAGRPATYRNRWAVEITGAEERR
ncbi:MAG: flagellar motor switch protein FliM [Planctomycetes bacterium]|nr:flagellar motor switch protein FliM [Planctomycetota bacterium]